MMMPFCTATPKSAMKPTPLATLRVLTGQMQRDQSSQRRQRHHAQDQHGLAERFEPDREKDQHHAHHQREDHQQPSFRAPLILELAAPLEPDLVPVEMHLCRYFFLCFLEIGGQIAVAIVDPDRQIALAILASDRALSRARSNLRQLRERHLHSACGVHEQIAESLR